MLLSYKRGQTSIILRVKLRDSSVSTGAGKTGLSSTSLGLLIGTIADNEATSTVYDQAGSHIESITTLGTFATPTAGKCRFKEVDATNHPGIYELQIADARFAVSSAKSLMVSISGVTNLAQCDVLIPLRDMDPYDAVRAGLTALPNANAEAAGGLYTRGSGAGQINQPANGQIDANTVKVSGTAQTARDLGASVLLSSGTGTGQLDFTSGVVKANLAQILGTALTETAGQIAAGFKKFFNIASPAATMDHGVLVDTVTTLTNAPSDSSGVTTLLSRIPSGLFTGITSLAQWLGLIAGKQTGNSTARTEIRATGAGSGTFDETTDSQEAIRDRGDAAWTTATGFSTLDASGVRSAVGLASANLDTQLSTIAGYVDTEVAAIKAKTDNLPASPAATGDVTSARDTVLVKLLKYVQLALRKDAAIATDNATELTAINADGGSGAGSFANTTDAHEAIRDNMGTPQTGDSYARLGAPAGASVSADIAAVKTVADAIKASTDNLPSDPADESLIIAATDAIAASIAALNDPSAASIADAVWEEPIADHSGTAGSTAEALANAGAAGTPPTAAEVADAVWEEAIADHSGTAGSTAEALSAAGSAGDPWVTALPGSYGAGSAGKIVGDALDAAVSSRLAASSYTAPDNATIGTINTNVSTLLSRITSTLFSGITSLAQWLGLLAGKQTGNSTARTELRATGAGSGTFDETTDSQEALRDRGDAAWTTATGFSTLDAAGVRSAVGLASANLDTQLDALPTAAETRAEMDANSTKLAHLDADVSTRATPAQVKMQADQALADVGVTTTVTGRIDAAVSTRAPESGGNLAAVRAKTDNLPSDPASEADIIAATDALASAITGLNDVDAATVKAQVVAALTTDANAEPTSVPAANASLADKLAWVFIRARNKQTAATDGTEQVYADDSTTVIGTGASSDDGATFTRGKIA